MAERRMFAKTIIDSDAFLDMPVTARLLYYDLAMRADDDGFINSPRKIMRIIGASQDDLTLLIAKKFIIPFECGVVVIKHWRIHNYIRKDMYHETKYKEEKELLALDENNAYTLSGAHMLQVRNEPVTDTLQDRDELVTNPSTQVRLGKDRLGKVNNIEKRERFTPPTRNQLTEYIEEAGLSIDADAFLDFYSSKGWKVGSQSMKDWKAAARNWARRDRQRKTPAGNSLGTFANYKQTSKDSEWDELTSLALKEVNAGGD